jgi:hypothetical protein
MAAGKVKLVIINVVTMLVIASNALAWSGYVHEYIAEKAGFTNIEASCPDRSDKGRFSNHYSNNDNGTVISATIIKKQETMYDKGEQKGSLYGAILQSYKDVTSGSPIDKKCEPIEYFVHYMGDLSAPFHNINREGWAAEKGVHSANDKANLTIIDDDEFKTVKLINCEDDIYSKVAELANESMKNGYDKNKISENLNDNEKKAQIIKSVNLLRGIKKYCLSNQEKYY